MAAAVASSAATTSCASAQGVSASSTSSGAADPASQAEDHTAKVAEERGTNARLTTGDGNPASAVRVTLRDVR
ncbi:hypothetical protein GCM10010472_16360 [Pseudonocardia halophobica]|uniref:Uncharacterized protein n=1 Tax=Pseudonocardia halophobica TaxID=29401 RepID=A0A9W6L138_9PSEU|nr:hypothetical protein GCM10017577_28270 [Pseudonocardia halophobica]